MARYRVQGPDGKIHVFEGPDGATPADVEAFAAATFAQIPQQQPAAPKPAQPERTFVQRNMDATRDQLAGLVRGTGSIGATLLAPIDAAARAVGVQNDFIGRTDRREAMDAGLRELVGADTDSMSYGVGKLGGEMLGTAGAGGVLAKGAAMVPGLAAKAPALVEAIRTAGMSAKGAGMGTRVAGGAITGGVSAGMVDPGSAGTGALIGGVAPPVLTGLGKAGRLVGSAAAGSANLLRNPQARAGTELARALEVADNPQAAAAMAARLRAAPELVPGSRPTMAQALGTPQAGVLQRVVHDSPGGSAVAERLMAQNAARLAALEGVAPTAPVGGFQQARQDLGEAVARYATGARDSARSKTSELYQAVPQDEAMLYLPELGPVRDRYFGPGAFTDRGAVDRAVAAAERVGTMELPGISAATGGRGPDSLVQAVRKAGGISLSDPSGVHGELVGLGGDIRNLVKRTGGVSPARLAERMAEAGFLPDDDVSTLLNALRDEAAGQPTFSIGDDFSRRAQAAAEAAMGDAPMAERIPQKVTLRDFEALRRSIGQEQRAAAMSGNDTAAKALGDMKAAMDDRINEVVRGDGAIDEDLPVAWADLLDQARASKVAEVKRFGTGPQAAIFKRGADGQPQVQGGEVMAKFWGNRPGLADDVDAFRRLIDDNPDLLGRFRSMVTTQGAGATDAAGRLGAKFPRWVESMEPGLRRTFSAEEFDLIQRIAKDIQRAESSAAAGMARGSPTYQNAANALDIGLLKSPMLNRAASMVPLGQEGLQWLQNAARDSKARRLAGVVADSQAAADALDAAGIKAPSAAGRLLTDPALAALFYRAGPVAAATSGDR